MKLYNAQDTLEMFRCTWICGQIIGNVSLISYVCIWIVIQLKKSFATICIVSLTSLYFDIYQFLPATSCYPRVTQGLHPASMRLAPHLLNSMFRIVDLHRSAATGSHALANEPSEIKTINMHRTLTRSKICS